MSTIRTLHFGLRVSDLERSLAFYTAVGYTVIGTVEGTAYGSLTMLQLPGDDFVTIELVYDPAKGKAGPGAGINHLVIQVESLDATRADLAAKGIEPEPVEYPGGPVGPRTCWITDPDGYRIEVLQWPDPCRRHHQGRLRVSWTDHHPDGASAGSAPRAVIGSGSAYPRSSSLCTAAPRKTGHPA